MTLSNNASLIIVGSGIKSIAHLTTETKAYIKQSDKVLYLVNEPIMKEWIERYSQHAESLEPIYTKYPLRLHCYRAITEYILENLYKKQHVCVVLYGHPTVFAKPALAAVIAAKEKGYYAKALPGISAYDCLFADLLIDPATHGCQAFEATDLLIRRRICDPHSHLLIWQAGFIGNLGHHTTPADNLNGIKLLVQHLSQWYNVEHQVILYEAAQYPHFEPVITKTTLNALVNEHITHITTLYLPPLQKAPIDEFMLKELGIDIADLK